MTTRQQQQRPAWTAHLVICMYKPEDSSSFVTFNHLSLAFSPPRPCLFFYANSAPSFSTPFRLRLGGGGGGLYGLRRGKTGDERGWW